MSNENAETATLLRLTTEIVSAYVSSTTIDPNDLPGIVKSVAATLHEVSNGANGASPQPSVLTPAVPIRKSVTPDYIICLEDGKKLKTLRRHLQSSYGMTAEAYRAKWNLPENYPMVAPNYAVLRSNMAKDRKFGQRVQFPT